MAIRTPLYLNFPTGAIREFDTGDFVEGSNQVSRNEITENYTISVSDGLLEVTTPDTTIYLPAASSITNYKFTIKNNSGSEVIIDANGSELIERSTTLILSNGDSCDIFSNGAKWLIV